MAILLSVRFMCLTFGLSWIGTTSSPASIHFAFKLFASPSHVHFDGQKPIVVVVKSVRSSRSDERPIIPKFLLLIDDDDIADDPMVAGVPCMCVCVYVLNIYVRYFHFISQYHDENDIAWPEKPHICEYGRDALSYEHFYITFALAASLLHTAKRKRRKFN